VSNPSTQDLNNALLKAMKSHVDEAMAAMPRIQEERRRRHEICADWGLTMARPLSDLHPEAAGKPRVPLFITSLIAWLRECSICGIRSVPAYRICEINVDDIWGALDGNPNPKIISDMKIINDWIAGHPRHMVRWDCCAPLNIKMAMGNHGAFDTSKASIELDDPRAIDILYEYPKKNVPVLGRPWIQAMMHGGWPVEFRVFIEDSKIIGVSNYYPQRDLPLEFEVLAHAAWDIASHLRHVGRGTADFLTKPDGTLIFLEGGPPHTPAGGAHMCCFEPGKIDGIALSNRNVNGDYSWQRKVSSTGMVWAMSYRLTHHSYHPLCPANHFSSRLDLINIPCWALSRQRKLATNSRAFTVEQLSFGIMQFKSKPYHPRSPGRLLLSTWAARNIDHQ